MKLILTHGAEKQLIKLKIPINQFVLFLKNTSFNSKKLIEICTPIDETKVYKAYLDNLKRAIIFCIHDKGIIYPVHIGDKNDPIAKNITVKIVRNLAEEWQNKTLEDIKLKKYKIRHY